VYLTAVRRRLSAVTWTILALFTVGVGAGAAQVCSDHEHTHRGVAAPDCVMHHDVQSGPGGAAHHSHHGGTADAAGDDDGARISCHCAGDAAPFSIGQIAILQPPLSYSPLVRSAVVDIVANVPATDFSASPPSPPPR
jgi:hypothetical protein